jgi:hypothetical protein
MKIDDMLNALPSKEDIAAAVGLQTRSPAGDVLTALEIFGTGMILGAGLALLFAPKPGDELRRTIADRVAGVGKHLQGNTSTASPTS